MDIASKISELNSRSEELLKSIEACKKQITENNRRVRKLAVLLKKTNQALGVIEESEEEKEVAQV